MILKILVEKTNSTSGSNTAKELDIYFMLNS